MLTYININYSQVINVSKTLNYSVEQRIKDKLDGYLPAGFEKLLSDIEYREGGIVYVEGDDIVITGDNGRETFELVETVTIIN